jgi:hypothetical protein
MFASGRESAAGRVIRTLARAPNQGASSPPEGEAPSLSFHLCGLFAVARVRTQHCRVRASGAGEAKANSRLGLYRSGSAGGVGRYRLVTTTGQESSGHWFRRASGRACFRFRPGSFCRLILAAGDAVHRPLALELLSDVLGGLLLSGLLLQARPPFCRPMKALLT